MSVKAGVCVCDVPTFRMRDRRRDVRGVVETEGEHGDDKRRICLNRSMSGMESVGTGNLGFAALERPADAAWTRGAEDGI